MGWNWKKTSISLPADCEEELQRMSDDELEAEAGPLIIYEVRSGNFITVATSDVLPKKVVLEALHDITEAIKLHGFPQEPITLTK